MKIAHIYIVFCLALLCSTTCEASWILYHKPEYKGRVVDIASKEPIEGAVVVAIYTKSTLNPPAGSYTNVIHVKETLTDKDGHFHFPSYTTLIHPLAYSNNCNFIIYKPGYGNLGQIGVGHHLSNVAEKVWERQAYWNKELVFRFLPGGTIEIPRLTSIEEMKKAWRNMGIWGAEIDRSEVPLLSNLEKIEENKFYPQR